LRKYVIVSRILYRKGKCQILKEENWGKRKLAYEIDKYREGQYYYIKYATIILMYQRNLKGFSI